MRTTQQIVSSCIALVALATPSLAHAQAAGGRGAAVFHYEPFQVISAEPMENVPTIANAPFTADATTEFTQILSDGNRIEQRFSTSLARDGRGRTRSEQDVAMLGPLVVLQKGVNWTTGQRVGGPGASEPPRFTVITDPVEGVAYTLDERTKEARLSPYKLSVTSIRVKEFQKLEFKLTEKGATRSSADAGEPVVESLGTRQIEGVAAEGTRSTSTIPAGQVGNLNPIQLVTERWFSKALQMAVLIIRRDPRSGETVYKLTSIVRAEPAPDLFTVPSDYRVIELPKKSVLIDAEKAYQIELQKLRKEQ